MSDKSIYAVRTNFRGWLYSRTDQGEIAPGGKSHKVAERRAMRGKSENGSEKQCEDEQQLTAMYLAWTDMIPRWKPPWYNFPELNLP